MSGRDEFLVALEDATMAVMGAEAALEELMEESVPAVMVLCEEIKAKSINLPRISV